MPNQIRDLNKRESKVLDSMLSKDYHWINKVIEDKVFTCGICSIGYTITVYGYFFISELMDRSNTLLDLKEMFNKLEYETHIVNTMSQLDILAKIEHPKKIELVTYSQIVIGDRVITQQAYREKLQEWFSITEQADLDRLKKHIVYVRIPHTDIPSFIFDDKSFHNIHNLGALLGTIHINGES